MYLKKLNPADHRITFVCSNTGELFNPDAIKANGSGGSEEALVWLTQLLAERGWQITVFASCGKDECQYGNVSWKSSESWNCADYHDIVVLWRFPSKLELDINARIIYLDLQEAISVDQLTPERVSRLTKIFVKSRFHRSVYPGIPDHKFAVIPNGIDVPTFLRETKRDSMLIINTSLPTRSLSATLDCYEMIKRRVPQAKLKWAYGWNIFDIHFRGSSAMKEWKRVLQMRMQELGVDNVGRLGHEDADKLYLQANIFAYPSEIADTDCISLSKAMAAGAVPITTKFAAMAEKAGHGGIFLPLPRAMRDQHNRYDFSIRDYSMKEAWACEAIRLIEMPPSEEARMPMRKWALETFDWNKIVDKWHKQIGEDLSFC